MKILNYIIHDLKEDLINEGGMANVYQAVDLHDGNKVAIKILKNSFFEKLSARKKFQEEANRYLYMKHPNIVELRNFILKEDKGFLVMEYVSGKNLRQLLSTVGPIPFHNVAYYINEILKALIFSHSQNILHLDIKPDNVMITSENEIKLIDFGISADSSKSKLEIIGHSPLYMSPEQIPTEKFSLKNSDSTIDQRSDIYSLGITMFQLLTGILPGNLSNCRTNDELYEAIAFTEIPSIEPYYYLDKPMSNAINKVIRNCTAKNPKNRYTDCSQFQTDIINILKSY
jgi:serine/threonine protein kinase